MEKPTGTTVGVARSTSSSNLVVKYHQTITISNWISSQTRKTPSCFPSGSSTLMPLASLVYTVQLHLHGFNVKVNDDVDGDVGCNEFSI